MSFSMVTSEAITQTYLLATGKSTPPSSGTAKYTKILALLNMFTQNWATEQNVNWKSLRAFFTVTSPATVTATDTFTIPTTAGKISPQEGDFVRINWTDGENQSLYTIVPIERLYNNGPSINNAGGPICAVSAGTIIFPVAFTSSSPEYGGTVKIPGYSIPSTLDDASDPIQVDDPFWVCFMAAAEYVRNDITRVQQYGNLISLANNSMQAMKQKNNSQEEKVYSNWSPLGSTWE